MLVGYTSSGAIIFAACKALGGTADDIASWMWALGWGMGICCIAPTLRYRIPVVAAWSTPGAALIATSANGITMPEAIGAFLLSSALIALAGVSGAFERLMNRIPLGLGSALLAGILLRFALDAFQSVSVEPLLILAMLAAHLIGRRWLPRYSVALVLATGAAILLAQSRLNFATLQFSLASPKWTSPVFSWQAMIGLGVPLFVVTMISQNLPGIAAIRAAKYNTPISPTITLTGVVNFVLAPFGALGLNLAAITAAIAMSPEAHPDARKRYIAALVTGVLYCIAGAYGSVVGGLFASFPRAFIVALAGLALLTTLGNSLGAALTDETERESALIAFLVAASGLTLFGIGSAFWAVVAGISARMILRRR